MLNALDNVVILVCIVGIAFVALHFAKSSQDMETYYRANRALPWSLMVGTLMASWYGGNGVVGTVAYSTTMGLAGYFIWSIGAHAVRFPLALWVAPRVSVRARGTMPEILRRHYGKFAAIAGAIVIVVSCLSIAEVGAAGYVGEAAWNGNRFLIATIIVLISVAITCLGGLMGVAVTDMIFFALMVGSVSLVFPKLFFSLGGMAGLADSMQAQAPELFTPFGGIPAAQAVLLILVCINMYKDPAFYQRFSAANKPSTGKRAMLTCFSIWLSFDMVCIITGMVIRSQDFALATQPEISYIRLVLSQLPGGARALFIVGIMGAIISTMDTYYLVGGEIISNDIIFMLRGDKALPAKTSILISRVACLAFGAIGLLTAFQFAFIYDAVILVTSLSMGVLFVPVLAGIMYRGKKTNVAGIASIVAGAATWLWFNFNPVTLESAGTIDAVIIALPVSFLAFVVGNFFGKDLTAEREGIFEKALQAGRSLEDSGLNEFDRKMIREAQAEVQSDPKDLKVAWLGIDGALVLLYIVLACIYGYGLLNQVDFVVGILAPGIAFAITAFSFFKYCSEILAFSKGKKNGKK